MNRRLTSVKRFLHSGRKREPRFSVKDGPRLKAFSRNLRCSAFIREILIHAIFHLPKGHSNSASATSKRKFVSIGSSSNCTTTQLRGLSSACSNFHTCAKAPPRPQEI